MEKRFQRRVEDFCCLHCGQETKGDGYTNHCPKCLWSRHVDVNPGDRLAECKGLMAPVSVLSTNPLTLLHRCVVCKHERSNRTSEEDDFEVVLELMRTQSSDT